MPSLPSGATATSRRGSGNLRGGGFQPPGMWQYAGRWLPAAGEVAMCGAVASSRRGSSNMRGGGFQPLGKWQYAGRWLPAAGEVCVLQHWPSLVVGGRHLYITGVMRVPERLIASERGHAKPWPRHPTRPHHARAEDGVGMPPAAPP